MKHVSPSELPLEFRQDARVIRELIDTAEQQAGTDQHSAALETYKSAYRASRRLPTRDLEIEMTLHLARYAVERDQLDSALDWLATHCILIAKTSGLQHGQSVTGNGITIQFATTASLHESCGTNIVVYRDFSDTWKNPFVLEAMADKLNAFGPHFLQARNLLRAIRSANPSA